MIKRLTAYISAIVLITQSLTALGQQPVASARLDTNTIRLGEQIGLQLQVSSRQANLSVDFPLYADTLVTGIEVLDTAATQYQRENNISRWVKRYTITGFDEGGFALPAQKIAVNGDTLLTNSLFLTVQTVPVDTTKQKLYDIKAPIDTPLTLKEFLQRFYLFIIGGLLMIAALTMAYIVFKRKAATKQRATQTQYLAPPHIEALSSLDRLESKKLWQAGKPKAYQSELTDIIRRYIYRAMRIPTLERTSDEILRQTATHPAISHTQQGNLKQLLELADWVKFAKYQPIPDEHERGLRLAREFVKETHKQLSADEQPTEVAAAQEPSETTKPESNE